MKIAVCFSGAFRKPEYGLESLKLIRPNDDIKVFAHTWLNLKTDKDYINAEMDQNEFSLIEKFNFETLVVEDYKSSIVHFKKMYNFFNFQTHEISPRTDLGIISMFYSIYQSNSLKRKYEIKNQMKFDKVIRIRFDSNFENKILDLENIDGDLCIPSGEDWFGINDRFSLGSSETMDVYCDIYNSFSLIRHIPYHPETMLNEFLKIRRIEPKRFDFNVSISSVRNY